MPLDGKAWIDYEVFQSTLAIADERCTGREAALKADCCFNPRSPLLTSDADPGNSKAGDNTVSIHARHC